MIIITFLIFIILLKINDIQQNQIARSNHMIMIAYTSSEVLLADLQ